MFDDVFKAMSGVEEYELILMRQQGLLVKYEGVKVQRLTSPNVPNLKFEINHDLNVLTWELDKFKCLLGIFRQDLISSVAKNLLGMELKRGCQYDREWIKNIYINRKTGEVVIRSTNDKLYAADKIRVYNTETTLTPFYNFAAMLAVTDKEEEGCQSCMG